MLVKLPGEIKTKWRTDRFLGHGCRVPRIVTSACWTERREEGSETQPIVLVLYALYKCFGVCVQHGSLKWSDAPGMEKNAWRAFNGVFTLQTFPPFSPQNKVTNSSFFLTPWPGFVLQRRLEGKGSTKPSLKSCAQFCTYVFLCITYSDCLPQ